ncbi:Homeodomain-like domain-containing protein [Methylobacterium sp. 174MFSha1.1]|uniref:helix-turn-helix domain-containing protein n=1 Tax=Methylobacterium sp. 174MFSha1.1 TaxID=1502749 RepID=UPI0008EDAB27|nr:helix-turn-helix domain-containing protein [Methylobacterium sp. 174MFSha1.1]SFU38643.1 Homeodomain-like domain-containing protein [Methylobacterium sp. 174MFSha1.1]
MADGLETFAKVRALHDRASTPGEKAAAASRMEVLARSVGMTVAEAVFKLDTPNLKTRAEAMVDAFNELFNSPEARAQRAKVEADRLAKCQEIMTRYDTEQAVFADTPREAALRAACAHIYEPRHDFEGAYRLAGWDPFDGRDKLPASVREAVCHGWPLPVTVAQAFAEFQEAERLEDDRCAINGGDYSSHSWVEARRYVLEELLDSLPARSMRDLRARLAWMQHVLDLGFSRPAEQDQACLNALRGDVDRMGERIRAAEHSPAIQTGHGERGGLKPSRYVGGQEDRLKSQTVQTGHRPTTRAERRAAAAALIAEGLSDREVARRLGISPTTVGTIRRSADSSS